MGAAGDLLGAMAPILIAGAILAFGGLATRTYAPALARSVIVAWTWLLTAAVPSEQRIERRLRTREYLHDAFADVVPAEQSAFALRLLVECGHDIPTDIRWALPLVLEAPRRRLRVVAVAASTVTSGRVEPIVQSQEAREFISPKLLGIAIRDFNHEKKPGLLGRFRPRRRF